MSDAKARRPSEIKPHSWSLAVSGKDDEHPTLRRSRIRARKSPPCLHTVGTERRGIKRWGILENFPGKLSAKPYQMSGSDPDRGGHVPKGRNLLRLAKAAAAVWPCARTRMWSTATWLQTQFCHLRVSQGSEPTASSSVK